MTTENETTFDELLNHLELDLNALHKCAQYQAHMAAQAGMLMAEAKAEAKRAELAAKEIEATVRLDIKANPDKYKLTKTTEDTVKDAACIRPEVLEANKKAIDAKEAADKADCLWVAFEHRKGMLKVEAELHSANYWGGPEASHQQTSGAEHTGRLLAEEQLESARLHRT
jgi:hypothetical protein